MSSSNVLKTIKDKEIEYVDLRFTDPRGKLQHVTMDAKIVDGDMLNEGIDIPDIECILMLRPTESQTILKQQAHHRQTTCRLTCYESSYGSLDWQIWFFL